MKKFTKAWGLDIGFRGLKAICVGEDGKVLEKKVYGVGAPLDAVDPWICLSNLVSDFKENLQRSRIAIGISGRHTLERRFKLPPIERRKIDDLVRYEAKQQIPFALEDVAWDWQVICDKGHEGPFLMESEILLQSTKLTVIDNLLKICNLLKLRPDIIQSNTIALTNALLLKHNSNNHPNAVISIGAETTAIVIANDQNYWNRNILIGGNHFTKALCKYLMIPFAKAEEIKFGEVLQTHEERAVAIKPIIADLVTEIGRSLMFYDTLLGWDKDTRIVGDVYLVGKTFELPGVMDAIIQTVNKAKDQLCWGNQWMNWASGDECVEAYALAMQALGKTKYTTNLLPKKKSALNWPNFNLKRFIPRIRIEFPHG